MTNNKRIRNKRSITIKDVARQAGVSVSTVSNALNKKRYVKEDTTRKIREIAEKLNYEPSMIARGLRLRSTRSIGVIVPDISNPFFAEMVRGMENTARKMGFTVLLCCTYYDVEEEQRQLGLLKNKWVDGFIFVSGYNTDDHIRDLIDQRLHVVAVDREITDFEVPSVLIDNKEAAKTAVSYLASLGHKMIAYLTFPSTNMKTVEDRLKGYKEGLHSNGLEFNQALVIIDESLRTNEMRESYQVVSEFMRKANHPTAIFAMDDLIAIGLLKALKDMGFRVPQDISVMGFDNIAISAFTDPPLTTIKQPKKRMGEAAIQLLIDLIERKKLDSKKLILPTELIIRGSVAGVRGSEESRARLQFYSSEDENRRGRA